MKDIKGKATLFIILLLCYPLVGQETDFSGKWALNEEKTRLGQMPEVILEISQEKDILNYKQITKGSSGELVIQMLLSMDGKEGSYTDSHGNQLKCSCAFRDGNLIVTYQSRQMRSGKWVILNIEEEHSLSADGKTLSIVHSERWGDRGGKWPRPMVFDKLTADARDVQKEGEKADSGLFTKQQLLEDTRQLLSYLENIHPDPYLYSGGKVAFHRRFQHILQSLPPDGLSKDDYIRLIRPFIASVSDAHTAIVTSYSYDRNAPGGIPLSFASIEKNLYVESVFSDQHTHFIGARLLSVEGVPFDELLQRMVPLRGIENEYHGLLMLSHFLWAKPYLKDLIPEWKDTTQVNIDLQLPDGAEKNFSFNLPQKKPSTLITAESKLQLPSTEKCDFLHTFLTPDKKTALLKVDGMMAYREMFESARMRTDISNEAAKVYERFHGEKAPSDLDSVIAGIPSAMETFRQLVIEMKDNETEVLIVDLTRNGGGDQLMSDILIYFLYGRTALAEILADECAIQKYSSFYFKQLTGRTIEGINQEYAQIQSYPLTENDYDFSYERYVDLALSGKVDTLTAMSMKYTTVQSFLEELKSGKYSGFYTPKTVIVTSSGGTFSSGFTMMRHLYKCGAVIVGSTSGQSGNGFGNLTLVILDNTKLKIAISTNANIVFPDEPNKRKVLIPHHELTYEKLKSYGFDPNAAVLYALEILPIMN